MNQARIIIVGGFLGAGKTTLLYAAATHLAKAGRRVGLITNDQAPELVDTVLLQKTGEAVLGWFNATYALTHAVGCDWSRFAQHLLSRFNQRFSAQGIAVGHVKLAITAGDGLVVANLVGTCERLSAHFGVAAGPAATLTLNARAQMRPAELEGVVEEVLAAVCGSTCRATVQAVTCLRPGRPAPTYQYTQVV